MRMTAIHTQTERKRQDRSVRCAEKHRRRTGMLRPLGPIRATLGVCQTTEAARGGKRLIRWRSQAILTSEGRPLGECRYMTSKKVLKIHLIGSLAASVILSAIAVSAEPLTMLEDCISKTRTDVSVIRDKEMEQYLCGLQIRERGVAYIRSFAERGDPVAQVALGKMYLHGDGEPQHFSEAAHWFTLAAAQGDAIAQVNLALMHENGFGMKQDYLVAHMWYNLAAARGEESAKKLRDKVAQRLTPKQIAEAQQRAAECISKNYKRC